MSELDRISIDEKLKKLQESVDLLEVLKTKDRMSFLGDKIIQSAAMFNLLIGIELIVDIGNHILSEEFQKTGKSYKDVIIYLGETKIVPQAFAEENAEMADFRNKLVHDYDRIDSQKVFDYLQKAPDVFRAFAKAYVEFLEKNT